MRGKWIAGLAVAVGMFASAASPASAAPQWSDGLVQRSYVTNCPSIIFGSPYQEEGAWTWTGQYIDPSNPPGVGEVFYIHVVVGAVGNPCPGGQYAHFELIGTNPQKLQHPAGMGTTYPVFCYAINWNANPPSAQSIPAYTGPNTGECPQAPQGGGFGYGGSWDAVRLDGSAADPWPMSQGRGWEIQIPVVATQAMSGGFGNCADCNQFLTKIIDGNSSPFLFPSQGLFVDNTAGGGTTNPGSGGTSGAGAGFAIQPQKQAPTPLSAVATGRRAAALKKCKKKKGAARKKCKKKALKLPA